jgi:hypothetical protein
LPPPPPPSPGLTITGPNKVYITSRQDVQSWDNYEVIGGTAPYTWSHSGTLPSGITLSILNGDTIRYYYQGASSQVGIVNITVYVTDANNRSSSINTEITIDNFNYL